jgi:hypothetical protein
MGEREKESMGAWERGIASCSCSCSYSCSKRTTTTQRHDEEHFWTMRILPVGFP